MNEDQRQGDAADHHRPDYHALRVEKIIEETPDACSVVLEIPMELSKTFAYKPGQFLTLKIPFRGKQLARSYSIASSPDCENEHKVTVKRTAGGRISNWINDNLRVGDVLQVMPPGGRFTLRAGMDKPLIMFAGGSGITPIISIIKSALATTTRAVRLVYANFDAPSIIFGDELDALAVQYAGRLEVIHSLDAAEGFVDAERVKRYVANGRDSEFFICGPTAFMNVVKDTLRQEGIDPAAIHIEVFVSPPDPDEVTDHAEEAASLAGEQVPETLTVDLGGDTQEVPYRVGQTILVACQQAGLDPPWSCTDGFCGSCMAQLLDGQARMINNDFLSDEELSEGYVLTCQSVPVTSTCWVKFPD